MRLLTEWHDTLWPDMSTEKGLIRGRRVAAAALLWIGICYLISALEVTDDLQETSSLPAAPTVLLAGALATTYLATRIRQQGCPIAAWTAFLWISCQTLDSLMGLNDGNPIFFFVLNFASFQGLRACSIGTKSETATF